MEMEIVTSNFTDFDKIFRLYDLAIEFQKMEYDKFD